jgi:hypothetical protein
MVPELRKRHRIIWQFGSLFLVAGFIAAVWVLPQPVPAGQWVQEQVQPFPQILAEKHLDELSARLKIGDSRHLQIEIIQKKAYPVPFAELLCNGVVLGTLGAQRQHNFNLKDTFVNKQQTYLLEIVDPINHQTIQKIKLP